MKKIKTLYIMLCITLLTSGCTTMSNTSKGAILGGSGGAALGAGIGALIGKGKGATIGAGIGAAVGAGAGTLIGKKMDKQQAELETQLANSAKIEETTDVNGYQAIKVTFDGGILFPTNGTTLSSSAKTNLSNFAVSIKNNPDTDVQIYGFTDNTGSLAVNERISTGRAEAVQLYLIDSGIRANRLSAQGLPMTDYIASNDTEAGRAQNRRVEIYITANENMIQKANDGTLK